MGAWTSPHNTITVAWVGDESFRFHKSRRYSEWRNRLRYSGGASMSRLLSDDTCRLDFCLIWYCGIKTSTAVDTILVKKYDLTTKKILWIGSFIGLFLVRPTFLLSDRSFVITWVLVTLRSIKKESNTVSPTVPPIRCSALMTTQLTMDLALLGDQKVADRLSIENNYIYFVSLT